LVQGESYLSGMSYCTWWDRDEGSWVGADGREGIFLGGVDVDCGDYFVKCGVHGTTRFAKGRSMISGVLGVGPSELALGVTG
jgi:hypothetical protein